MENLDETEITKMIHRGGVFTCENKDNLHDILLSVLDKITLPSYLTKEVLFKSLMAREDLLSTAVGDGFAIPHSINCLINNKEEQSIIVVYLNKPLKYSTPDLKPLTTLFIVLSMNREYHTKTLDALARLFQNIHFKNAIRNRVSEPVLAAIINNLA